MRMTDQNIFAAFENAEMEDPTAFNSDNGRRIYCSRDLGHPKSSVFPVLTDFSNAQIDSPDNNEDCQPWQYRAPEVILEMPWSYEIDIWNVGVLVRLSLVATLPSANYFRYGICSKIRRCSLA
jgi:serine/threonine-protein kinase SRPK3